MAQRFTILEMVAAVAIAMVLGAIALPLAENYLTRSKEAETALVTAALQDAQNGYYAAHDAFWVEESSSLFVFGALCENCPNKKKHPVDYSALGDLGFSGEDELFGVYVGTIAGFNGGGTSELVTSSDATPSGDFVQLHGMTDPDIDSVVWHCEASYKRMRCCYRDFAGGASDLSQIPCLNQTVTTGSSSTGGTGGVATGGTGGVATGGSGGSGGTGGGSGSGSAGSGGTGGGGGGGGDCTCEGAICTSTDSDGYAQLVPKC